MAKQRENDVDKVKEILHDLRKNELTGAIEYTDHLARLLSFKAMTLT